MLTRSLTPRLRTLTSSVPSLRRSFTAVPSLQRSPALGDIGPDNGPTFDAKQRAFREKLAAEAEAKKRKEAEESACCLALKWPRSSAY
jgi:hypothetical protein